MRLAHGLFFMTSAVYPGNLPKVNGFGGNNPYLMWPNILQVSRGAELSIFFIVQMSHIRCDSSRSPEHHESPHSAPEPHGVKDAPRRMIYKGGSYSL